MERAYASGSQDRGVGNVVFKVSPVVIGEPNDSDVPEFMTIGTAVDGYVKRIMPEILQSIRGLEQIMYIAPQGVEGVMVPQDVYQQLIPLEGQRKGINFKQLRKSPSSEEVDRVIEDYVAMVQKDAQEDARSKIRGGIKEQDPKLAATLEAKIVTDPFEAAQLLGMG